MSDSYVGDYSSGIVNVSLTDDNGGKALDRATKLLAGFPGGVEKAAESALSRAATSGRAGAAREVNKQYFLKVSDFKKYTKSYQHVKRSGNEINVGLEFHGFHVPLVRFNSRLSSTGRIRVQVRRDSVSEELRHVFRATMASGHIGLFERSGTNRLPIEQKFGPSVPQMMGANENLASTIGDQMRNTFEDRMEHEVLAVLNGWNR